MSKEIGNFGEDLATRYLKEKGYRVLARNWRASGVEVDIVVEKDGETVFVEVKTRRSVLAGHPEESVTSNKRGHLERVAHAWLVQHTCGDVPWRIDVIAIQLYDDQMPEIVHFQGI